MWFCRDANRKYHAVDAVFVCLFVSRVYVTFAIPMSGPVINHLFFFFSLLELADASSQFDYYFRSL